jgi:branched-chain amino acid transport system ATP-binding protein
MKDQGVAVVLVEQRLDAVLSIADRVAFIENGHGREVVDAEVLRTDTSLLEKYVGV